MSARLGLCTFERERHGLFLQEAGRASVTETPRTMTELGTFSCYRAVVPA
jgi:hypothetical protein